jgi:hypothetical protein
LVVSGVKHGQCPWGKNIDQECSRTRYSRKINSPKKSEAAGDCLVRNFIIYKLRQTLLTAQQNEEQDLHAWEVKRPLARRRWGRVSRWMLRKYCTILWSEFIWLEIGTSS